MYAIILMNNNLTDGDMMKNIVVRITSAVIALIMIACVFSSCKSKKSDDEEITRSNQVIAGPVTTAENGETTTGTETTGGETTAAAGTATTKASSSLSVPSVTTPNFNSTTAASSSNNSAGAIGSMGSTILGALANADPDTIAAFVNNMGFGYDADQGVFYSLMDSWQRDANFISQYDKYAAICGNMRYLTTTIDFYYDGLDWRIQLWKGQYGTFGGGEVGVYTKNPKTNDKLYNCADNDHLLNMYYDLYTSASAYASGNRFFYRDAWTDGGHWWLTGFKLGTVNPQEVVMSLKIKMRTRKMANAFEDGLIKAGFYKGNAYTNYDSYKRDDRVFYILWYHTGSLNY